MLDLDVNGDGLASATVLVNIKVHMSDCSDRDCLHRLGENVSVLGSCG